MSYSYTEKRRIRKNFGRLPKVMKLPKLIETQLESYTQFLQQHVEAGARENKGLEEVFRLFFLLLVCLAMLPLNMFHTN
jgi:DNA-directed RNA polymerase subunit beta